MHAFTPIAAGLALALGSSIALAGAPAAAAQAPSVDNVAIPAMPLKRALGEFARHQHLQLVYVSNVADGVRTQGAAGGLPARAELAQLLRGTGLQYRFLDARTVTISYPGQDGATHASDPPPPPDAPQSDPQSTKPQTLQAVVVTGTHIRSAQLATSNPVITVTSEQIAQTGDLTLGEVVRNLPAVAGTSLTPNVNNQGSTNDTGAVLLGLRGLGASRTLILINGQRILNTDIDAIPAAAIDRIEVLTSGASSIYGSDAIGGVINFILKKKYQGAQLQLNYGISDHNDGQREGGSFVFGQSSNKGSIYAGVSYNKMDAIQELARSISRDTLSIEGGPDTPIHSFIGGTNYATRGFIALPQDLQSQFGCTHVALKPSALGTSAPTTLSDFHCYTSAADGFSYSPFRPLTDPQERTNGFFSGNYRLASHVTATMTVLHTKTDSAFTLGPPVWGDDFAPAVVSQYSMYNPFGVTYDPTNGNVFRGRLTGTSNRTTSVSRVSDELMFGLHGDWTMLGHHWSWDIGYNYGHLAVHNIIGGLVNMPQVMPGLGPSMLVDGVPRCVATPGDPTSVISGCTPWDPFNVQNPTTLQVAQAAVTQDLEDFYNIERIKYFDITGGLFDLPGGSAQLAVGADWRDEYANAAVGSGLLITNGGSSCALGSQCTAPLHGGFSVKEAYAELFLPVLSQLPGVYSLSFDLGDRYSKYSDFGSTANWKIGVEYHPIEDLLLRGSITRVFRAPTIEDIFGAPNIAGVTVQSDPCNGITAPNQACVGVPTDGTFVDSQIASHQQVSVIGSGSAFADFPLGPEKGKSFDFGAVWSPGFLPGFSASVDAWRIYLNNVITAASGETVLLSCFNGDAIFCPLIDRFGEDTTSPGQLVHLLLPTVNLGRIDVKGTDVKASYRMPQTALGTFTVGLSGTYLSQYKLQTDPGTPSNQVINEAGNINIDQGLNLLPRVRGQGVVGWQLGPWNASWRVQYIGRFDMGSADPTRHYTAVPGLPSYVLHYGATLYSDVQVGYLLKPENTAFQIGVNNVFDKEPPLLYQNNITAGNGNTDSADFDVIGRYYWARVTVNF